MPVSKGFLYLSLINFSIKNMFKLKKDINKLIFKIYLLKTNNDISVKVISKLINEFENNYVNIIHYRKL